MSKWLTAIVIEDDSDIGSVFAEIMKYEGISVLGTGHNGKEAIELFGKYRPKIVILDLMMPDFDGFYAINGIQKIDPEAKFLVLTGDVTEETRIRLSKIKTVHTIYKPYEIFNVINEIRKFDNESALVKKN